MIYLESNLLEQLRWGGGITVVGMGMVFALLLVLVLAVSAIGSLDRIFNRAARKSAQAELALDGDETSAGLASTDLAGLTGPASAAAADNPLADGSQASPVSVLVSAGATSGASDPTDPASAAPSGGLAADPSPLDLAALALAVHHAVSTTAPADPGPVVPSRPDFSYWIAAGRGGNYHQPYRN
jgi:Na+-transporting methylmalonyl-CoA/oxaloacetate decarboxylase gamma subunit